jgi:hypothetical protein
MGSAWCRTIPRDCRRRFFGAWFRPHPVEHQIEKIRIIRHRGANRFALAGAHADIEGEKAPALRLSPIRYWLRGSAPCTAASKTLNSSCTEFLPRSLRDASAKASD